MREAFTRSINPFFGKVGIYILGADRLNETAGKFLFNFPIAFDFPIGESRYVPPTDAYEAAALACGFNSLTTITPIHAAMMAGAVANRGSVANPKLIKTIYVGDNARYVGGCDTTYNLIRAETSRETMKVMSEVIRKGTARKGFAHILRGSSLSDIQMGGKTGNLNSESPRGRCDWFAGYALDSKNPENSICVAVVTVHGPYWNVHSSYLGAEAIKTYFSSFKYVKSHNLGSGRSPSEKRS
jgi:cell division protein FtsI/penicillin-binding protein 2